MAITIQEIDAEIARRERIAELDAEIAKRENQQNPSFMDSLSTAPESLATMISGGVGALAGGITGAATTALTMDPAAGEFVRQSVQDKLTLNPSPQAQSQLQSLGGAIESIDQNIIRPAEAGTAGLFNVATHPYSNITQGFEPSKQITRDVKEQGLPKYVGSDVLAKTGSPLAATAADVFTGAAEMFSGNLVGKYTNKAINEALKTSQGRRKLIADEILKGNDNTKLVTKMVNNSGDVVTNPAAKKALKYLGGDENAIELVSMVEHMSDGTKKSFNEMLDIIDNTKIRPSNTLDARHTDVIGKSILNRVKDVNRVNEKAGKLIGKIATEEKRLPYIQDISNKFMNDLEGLGVKFSRGEDGWISADFARSKFRGGDKQSMEVMINDLAKGDMSFLDAHKLKQTIRDNVNYDVGGKDQLTKVSEDLLENLSGEINEKLREISPNYKKANAKFADTIKVKNNFDKMLGRDVKITDELAHKALGMRAMRLDSNATTKIPIEAAINNVDETLAKLGIHYKDDIKALVLTAGRLEDAFKTQPKNSLLGRMTTAVKSPVDASIDAGVNMFKNISQADFDKKMKSVRLLSKPKGNK